MEKSGEEHMARLKLIHKALDIDSRIYILTGDAGMDTLKLKKSKDIVIELYIARRETIFNELMGAECRI